MTKPQPPEEYFAILAAYKVKKNPLSPEATMLRLKYGHYPQFKDALKIEESNFFKDRINLITQRAST